MIGDLILLERENEQLRAKLAEELRLNGMGSEREARLMAKVSELERKLNPEPGDVHMCVDSRHSDLLYRVAEIERERDEWKQHAATGVEVRRIELAQLQQVTDERDAARAEAQRAWDSNDDYRKVNAELHTELRAARAEVEEWKELAAAHRENYLQVAAHRDKLMAERVESCHECKRYREALSELDRNFDHRPEVQAIITGALATQESAQGGKDGN